MISKETFDRLRSIAIDFENCMYTRIGGREEENDLKAERAQADRDIDELEKFWETHR